MKLDKLKIQTFIENFNKDFKTKIELKNKPFLTALFENFVSILSSYTNSKEELDKIVDLQEKIYSVIEEKEDLKILFDEYNKFQEKFYDSTTEQAFIYGFCACQQLNIESNK